MGRSHSQTSRESREGYVIDDTLVYRLISIGSQQLGLFSLGCGIVFAVAIIF
jgi:hypothetical protein